MNYANLDNHNYRALLDYADPIVKQLWPAIATYGFLSLFPGLGLRKVFENGIMEFIAGMTLPFSLACASLFCGLSIVFASRYPRLRALSQRCSGYWASFCVSLCAATLGVVAGLFIPYICANGILQALKFLCIGLLVALSYGWISHQIGMLTFISWIGRATTYRPWFGMAYFVVGLSLVITVIYSQWMKVNGL